jgi:uncharacterized protein (DUF1697 family)
MGRYRITAEPEAGHVVTGIRGDLVFCLAQVVGFITTRKIVLNGDFFFDVVEMFTEFLEKIEHLFEARTDLFAINFLVFSFLSFLRLVHDALFF